MNIEEPAPKRYEENVLGKYYVLDSCNGCGLCLSMAIHNFAYSDDGSYYFVYKQPETSEEENQCQEAMKYCPMNCIRDDGDTYETFDSSQYDDLYY